jgi:hypothetical protein
MHALSITQSGSRKKALQTTLNKLYTRNRSWYLNDAQKAGLGGSPMLTQGANQKYFLIIVEGRTDARPG